MGLLMRYVHQQRELVRLEKEAIVEIKKIRGGRFESPALFIAENPEPVLSSLPNWFQRLLGNEEYRPVKGVVYSIVHLMMMDYFNYVNSRE